jgi:hypothetical protein
MPLFPKPVVKWKVPREYVAYVRAREGPIPFWVRPMGMLVVGLVWVGAVYTQGSDPSRYRTSRPGWAGMDHVGIVLFMALFCAYVAPWIMVLAARLTTDEVKVFECQLVYTVGGKPIALKWPSIRGYFWLEHEWFLVLVLVVARGARERRVYLGAPKAGDEQRMVEEMFALVGVHRWYPDENPFAEAWPEKVDM